MGQDGAGSGERGMWSKNASVDNTKNSSDIKKTNSSEAKHSEQRPSVLTSVWSVFSNVWGNHQPADQQNQTQNISTASTTAPPNDQPVQEPDTVSTFQPNSSNNDTNKSKSSTKSYSKLSLPKTRRKKLENSKVINNGALTITPVTFNNDQTTTDENDETFESVENLMSTGLQDMTPHPTFDELSRMSSRMSISPTPRTLFSVPAMTADGQPTLPPRLTVTPVEATRQWAAAGQQGQLAAGQQGQQLAAGQQGQQLAAGQPTGQQGQNVSGARGENVPAADQLEPNGQEENVPAADQPKQKTTLKMPAFQKIKHMIRKQLEPTDQELDDAQEEVNAVSDDYERDTLEEWMSEAHKLQREMREARRKQKQAERVNNKTYTAAQTPEVAAYEQVSTSKNWYDTDEDFPIQYESIIDKQKLTKTTSNSVSSLFEMALLQVPDKPNETRQNVSARSRNVTVRPASVNTNVNNAEDIILRPQSAGANLGANLGQNYANTAKAGAKKKQTAGRPTHKPPEKRVNSSPLENQHKVVNRKTTPTPTPQRAAMEKYNISPLRDDEDFMDEDAPYDVLDQFGDDDGYLPDDADFDPVLNNRKERRAYNKRKSKNQF